jgi:hypothetical protein
MISISAEEKSAFAESTAEDNTFPGRYVVELNVFHQLHCLVFFLKLPFPYVPILIRINAAYASTPVLSSSTHQYE